jgi:hypothetical protein
MIKLVGAVMLSWLLFSCSAQWHLNKALQKDPDIIQADTVVKVDTVYRTIRKVDTVIQINRIPEIDTLELVKYINRNIPGKTVYDTVKIYLNRQDDSLNVGVDCPDCPQITKQLLIEKGYILKPSWIQQFWNDAGWWIFGLVMGFVGTTIYWKLIKR